MKDILETLAQGRDLERTQADDAFGRLMNGELTEAQAAALLMGLRAKGETAEELGAGVAACLHHARLVKGLEGPSIDTCGTGGDNKGSFNCSTGVALVLATMGYKVVKHGNRSVSSTCGSADVLEAMGMRLDLQPEEVPAALENANFAFLFAPNFHPAFKYVVPVRKALGIRTLFNMMGPLLNPARPTHQILGVANKAMMPLMAATLAENNVTAAVVHGHGGYDELCPFGPNTILWVRDGKIEEQVIDPLAIGLGGGTPDNVRVNNKAEALDVLAELLDGQGPVVMQQMLLLNLTIALMVLEDDQDMYGATMKAREVLMSGDAGRKFQVMNHAG
ncbi:MAG: anthranilate phosphoribosyltransferase [Desulfovibrio sp.]|uniref:anthranilate phosphoribosyltransferase n=1 Tax=Desulfovibrio sp. 7SRBS1 TaxID=3378064 RepID=UPI003B3F1F4A